MREHEARKRGRETRRSRRRKRKKVSSITAPHPVSAHQVDLVTRGDTAPSNCAAPFDTRHPMSQKGDSAGSWRPPSSRQASSRLSLGNIAWPYHRPPQELSGKRLYRRTRPDPCCSNGKAIGRAIC